MGCYIYFIDICLETGSITKRCFRMNERVTKVTVFLYYYGKTFRSRILD